MIEQIADYLKEHYPACRKWETLYEFLKWNCAFRTIDVVMDKEKIVGVGIARMVSCPEEGIEDYNMNIFGTCCFVDLVIASSENVKKSLYEAILKKLGNPETIAFKRIKRSGAVKVYPFHSFMRRFSRGR